MKMTIVVISVLMPLVSFNVQARPDCIKPSVCDDGGNSCEKARAAYQGCVEGWSQDDWSEYYSNKGSGNSQGGSSWGGQYDNSWGKGYSKTKQQ